MDTDALKRLESLNQLALTDEERARVLAFFDAREADREKLNAIDTANTEVMVHVMPMVNVLRPDVVVKNFSREDLQSGAPETMDDYWQVPRLVG